jgi:hypothetical protein
MQLAHLRFSVQAIERNNACWLLSVWVPPRAHGKQNAHLRNCEDVESLLRVKTGKASSCKDALRVQIGFV